MTPLKVAFAGTPDFAVPCLQALIEMPEVEVVVVYTQPDRPVGRGRKTMPTPVKQAALQAGIEVRQPEKTNNLKQRELFAALNVDVMVVVAYGMLLTQQWLNTPRLGCLNVHASILPRWRGAAPIQRAIEAGDINTGVSLMQMHATLDAGPVYATEKIAISPADTAATLHDKLSQLGAHVLQQNLTKIASGKLTAQPQNPEQVTYAHKLAKNEAPINWQLSANSIVQKIHAFNPWPVASCQYEDMLLRIWQASVVQTDSDVAPGTIIRADNELHIQSGDKNKAVAILQVQKPGGKAMPIEAFLAGTTLTPGSVMR